MYERIKDEPVLVTGFIQAVLGLAMAFGFDLTNEQVGSILAVTAASLAFIARGKVTPTRKIPHTE